MDEEFILVPINIIIHCRLYPLDTLERSTCMMNDFYILASERCSMVCNPIMDFIQQNRGLFKTSVVIHSSICDGQWFYRVYLSREA